MDSFTSEMQTSISIVRSVLSSRKDSATISEIMADYMELEGQQVPKFGYRTVEDFLFASKEFIMEKVNNQYLISPKVNKNSLHILKLVHGQKTNKTKRIRAPRRLNRSGNLPHFSSQTATSAYSKMYSSQRPAALRSSRRTATNNHQQNRNQSNRKPSKQSSSVVTTLRNGKSTTSFDTSQQYILVHVDGKPVYKKCDEIEADIATDNVKEEQLSNSQQRQQPVKHQQQQQQQPILEVKQSNVQQKFEQSKKDIKSQRFETNINQEQLSKCPNIIGAENKRQITQILHQNIPPNKNYVLIADNNNNNTNDIINNNHNNNNNGVQVTQPVPPTNRTQSNQEVRSISLLMRQHSNRAEATPVPITQKSNVHERLFTSNESNERKPSLSQRLSRLQHSTETITVSIKNENNNNNTNNDHEHSNTSIIDLTDDLDDSHSDDKHLQSMVMINDANNNNVSAINFNELEKLNPIKALEIYCKLKKYAMPQYKFNKIKRTGRIQGRVLILNKNFSTYPLDFAHEMQAKLETAKVAIHELREFENFTQYSMCMESHFDLTIKLYNMLKEYETGYFKTKIPELFQLTFQQSLPMEWFKIILDSPQMFTISESIQDDFIIYACVRKPASSIASINSSDISNTIFDNSEYSNGDLTLHQNTSLNNDSITTTTTETPDEYSTDFKKLAKLTLPWNEKNWNIFITSPISTVEIWGRLIGNQYSELIDEMTDEIELSKRMGKAKLMEPSELKVNSVYVVAVATECWYRIRIDRIEMNENRSYCFFIDAGDSEWINNNEIYRCNESFLKVPPQAICFSLFALEDFAENPYAKRHLDEQLNSKALIGVIITKFKDYEEWNMENGGKNGSDGEPKIQTIFFDTSSEDDIFLNPLILDRICLDTPKPKLKHLLLTHGIISYINDYGDVYLQIDDSGIRYIRKIIHNLMKSDFNYGQYRLSATTAVADPDADKIAMNQNGNGNNSNNKEHLNEQNQLYLIMDKNDSKWYRATILSENLTTNIYEMFYVDYGMVRPVSNTMVYRLNLISEALYKYPYQAIRVQLHNVDELNESNIATLRGQLKENTKVIVKQMGTIKADGVADEEIPSVNIYKRLEKDNILVSINESIRIEQEELEISLKFDKKLNISDCNSNNNNNNSVGEINPKSLSNKTQIHRSNSIGVRQPPSIADNPIKKLPPIGNHKLPNINEIFNVCITMASNPTFFKIRSHSDAPALHELMCKLQKYCSNHQVTDNSDDNGSIPSAACIPASNNIIIGEAYAGLHQDGNWYRVIVENIYDERLIHVSYCDYGDIEIFDRNQPQLKHLPIEFRLLPKQAISAKLFGIQPKNKDWNLEDCLYFQKLTVNKQFVSFVKNITIDHMSQNGSLLELVLVDVSTNVDMNINELFINEKRADLLI